MQFDTFGFTAAELARKQAEKEQQKRFVSSAYHIHTLLDLKSTSHAINYFFFTQFVKNLVART